jgi:hypothetical protein
MARLLTGLLTVTSKVIETGSRSLSALGCPLDQSPHRSLLGHIRQHEPHSSLEHLGRVPGNQQDICQAYLYGS